MGLNRDLRTQGSYRSASLRGRRRTLPGLRQGSARSRCEVVFLDFSIQALELKAFLGLSEQQDTSLHGICVGNEMRI
jgi:hypothetical protein